MNQLPFGMPFSVMAKPAGSACNLRCKYCYYLEKKKFYKKSDTQIMSLESLDLFIREYIASQPTVNVVFNWHGGEALLRTIDFYEKIIELQTKYGVGREISNTIQTNGTLLTDEWCEFFKKYNWLVGVSIDGPQALHDKYRLSRKGESSFAAVMDGIEKLNRHGVEWNILATVNAANADYPEETYNFLKGLGTPFIQFTPVVERIREDGMLAVPADKKAKLADFSVDPVKWGNFICKVFDIWVKSDVGTVFVQLFDATLANRVGVKSPVCTMAKECGDALAVEFNGDVYSCDHFVFPDYKLGNIYRNPFWKMAMSPEQRKFGSRKYDSLPKKCLECPHLWGCHGECPRNRFVKTAERGKDLNYLCEGYQMFFEHVTPAMDFMKRQLETGNPPANIMNSGVI